jgi:hypothetical protein
MYLKTTKLSIIHEKISKSATKLIKEVEKEEIYFLSPPHTVSLALGLYINEPVALSLFNFDNSLKLKDKLIQILKKFILVAKEEKIENQDSLRIITPYEIFETLSHLKDFMLFTMWCRRRVLTKILKSSKIEENVKWYGEHGQTDIYKYLQYLEYVLASFNLATSFGLNVWWSQIFEKKKSYQEKYLRITTPGILFLDLYADYIIGKLTKDELASQLEKLILLPKIMLETSRKIINEAVEITLFLLAKYVAAKIESSTEFIVTPYTQILANDIINLLQLYDSERLDIDILIKKILVRWKK